MKITISRFEYSRILEANKQHPKVALDLPDTWEKLRTYVADQVGEDVCTAELRKHELTVDISSAALAALLD